MEQDIRDALTHIYQLVAENGEKTNAKLDKICRYIEEQESKKYLNNEFFEVNGSDTFVKLKANSLDIGKLQFAFVKFEKGTNKSLESLDIYLNISEALELSNDILTGRITALAEQEKLKGAQYPGAVWKSPLGGINEANAKSRGLRSDGKAISRMFTLSPGSRQPFVLTAEQRPGNSNSKGLIVPEFNGKPEIQIRVPLDGSILKKLALEINSEIIAYKAGKYANKDYYVAPTKKINIIQKY